MVSPLFLCPGHGCMSGESNEVQLVRLEVQMTQVLSELRDSKESRSKQYESIEALRLAVQAMVPRVENVENKLAGQAPTIEEFITIKHKVQGAGQMGHWLWIAGAFLLGVAAKSREAILHWFVGGGSSTVGH